MSGYPRVKVLVLLAFGIAGASAAVAAGGALSAAIRGTAPDGAAPVAAFLEDAPAGRGTAAADSHRDPVGPGSAAIDSSDVADSLAAAADSLPGRHPAMAVGERLVFNVRYGVIKAGTAVMEIVDRRKVAGRPAYHVVSTASSNSMFDGIYRVRDQVVSLMDEKKLHSLYFEKHLREGHYRADQQVRFDQARGVAIYQDGQAAPCSSGAFDVLAAFYRVRTMPLRPGQRFFLESHDNRKNYPLRVSVLRRERIECPAGSFDCLVVEPTLRSGAFFKNEGRLTIWLTDDDRRMPVVMRSKLPIGAISVELVEYHRPAAASREGTDAAPGAPASPESPSLTAPPAAPDLIPPAAASSDVGSGDPEAGVDSGQVAPSRRPRTR